MSTMKKQLQRSNCPINFSLETFGDSWSLLIIRDIVFWGKKTYGEFLESKEGIASNILAARLRHLVEMGLLRKLPNPKDRRQSLYQLTDKGLDLIPMLLEMAGWATRNDPHTSSPRAFVEYIYAHREDMFKLIRETVQNGGSLFAGKDRVIDKVKQ